MDKKYAGIIMAEGGNILSIIELALNMGLDQAIRNTTQSSKQIPVEPDWVYGIFQTSIPLLDEGLNYLLGPHGVRVSVTGIYCHQSPKVNFKAIVKGTKSECELGDILIVIDRGINGKHSYNGILLQTKKDHRLPNTLKISADQFRLYNAWPKFEYSHGRLRGAARQVTPNLPHPGAQIGWIQIPSPFYNNLPTLLTTAAVSIPQFRILSVELFALLLDISGRVFTDKVTARKGMDWDCVMWDLLEVTGNLTFNLSSSGVKNASRKSVFTQTSGQPAPPALLLQATDKNFQEWHGIWDTDINQLPPHEDDSLVEYDDSSGISSIIMQLDLGE